MRRLFNREKTTVLDEPIENLLTEMNRTDRDSELYAHLVNHLERLMRLKSELSSKNRVSADTMAIVLGNLFGILIVVGYEHAHPLSSKAMAFIMRPRATSTTM